ncbi:phospholipid scramblase-related protein [Ferrimonas sp.]|uniref:phospholipid scramblase-related protein n=1 Tax=Ferrimonas sp. TaxID=2080861 RepID=UPI003A913571
MLENHSKIRIQQLFEMAELFGFESRNRYQVLDAQERPLGYAAEQSSGMLGTLSRQLFGHWRRFDIHLFSPQRAPWLIAHHPFRWWFQRLEVSDASGVRLGAVQQRFALLHKKFDIEDEHGRVMMTVASPLWRIWTFPVERQGREVACISKRWSGGLTELFTDKDNFVVEYSDPSLDNRSRQLLLMATLFIDLQYFEKKAGD